MNVITELLNSFNNNSDTGFSGRKLSAFAGVISAIFLSYKHTNDSNITVILGIWLAFALLCLGIITAEQIIKFKNDK